MNGIFLLSSNIPPFVLSSSKDYESVFQHPLVLGSEHLACTEKPSRYRRLEMGWSHHWSMVTVAALAELFLDEPLLGLDCKLGLASSPEPSGSRRARLRPIHR